jgi:hypothetical protein
MRLPVIYGTLAMGVSMLREKERENRRLELGKLSRKKANKG